MSGKAPPGDSRAYFDRLAPEWAELRKSLFPDTVREQVLEAAWPPEGGLAADIGAGNGFLTEALVGIGVRVIAVDRSEPMLHAMHSRFAGQPVEVRQGEAEALPIADGQVDCALANMYLHHVERPEAAVREMARILKPGGRLVIADLERHEQLWLLEEHHDRWPGFTRLETRAWFQGAGLREIDVSTLEDCCRSRSEASGEEFALPMFLAKGVK